jgi:hypothetical protein
VQQRWSARFSCVLEGSVRRRLRENSVSPWVRVVTGKKRAPERVFIDRSLEYKESMSFVVNVDLLTVGAEVHGAVCTAVPLPNDLPHVPVAKCKGMCKIMQVNCFDIDEHSPRHNNDSSTYLRGPNHLTCLRDSLARVQRDIDTCKIYVVKRKVKRQLGWSKSRTRLV